MNRPGESSRGERAHLYHARLPEHRRSKSGTRSISGKISVPASSLPPRSPRRDLRRPPRHELDDEILPKDLRSAFQNVQSDAFFGFEQPIDDGAAGFHSLLAIIEGVMFRRFISRAI